MTLSRATRDVAVSATGLLRDFSDAGVLGWADVHTAAHTAHLFGEADERVRLALALTVRALRAGSLCVDLADAPRQVALATEEAVTVPPEAWPPLAAWLDAVRASPAVTPGPDPDGPPRPARLVDGLLYLERSWRDQESVRTCLVSRLPAEPPRLADGLGDQDRAVALAKASPLTVIAGGPGTGKTTIIRRLLAEAPGRSVGLAAPTGKAAARMTESLRGAGSATTLHRLLGWKPGAARTRFRHDANNPLPHDLVVVDEVSMVSMTLMARLAEALAPGARLVLVGDPDQLASVEAGSVLADLTAAPRLAPVVTRLTHNHRFAGAIAALAGAVRDGDADRALGVLASGDPAVRLVAPDRAEEALRPRCVTAGGTVFAAAQLGDAGSALAALQDHRLLCAHRTGPHGVAHWIRVVRGWLAEDVPSWSDADEFYAGRPLMLTVNTPDLDLANGDTGVVVAGADGGPVAAFATGSGVRRFSPHVIDGLVSVDAMTIHKSQGSQFTRVSVVLPPEDSPLLTRELLYTAVTRAQADVVIVGTPEAVRRAIETPAARTSGLVGRLT